MKVKDLNIATRLGAGFGIVLLLMVALIATALLHLRQVGTLNEKMIEEDWAKANAANVIDATVRANARRTMELFLVNDKAARDAVKEKIEGNKRTINEALGILDRLVRSADGKTLLSAVKDERARYVASFTRVSGHVEEGRRDEAHRLLLEETLPMLDKLQESVKSLTDFQTRLVQDSGASVQADISSAGATMLALGIIAVAIGLAFSIWLTISITRPLQKAVRIAETVASGDLTSRIEVSSRDETGQLLQALERMNGNLKDMVSEVKTGTETIATASVQISAGNLDLSSRTEEQASSLQQTASSMEQLTSAVRQNAVHAKQANMLALNASQVATAGNQAIEDVVSTMSAINTSAARIAEITGLIDGIAFQTNILALNASVEAARAGEHGRGFAVVAGEVRTLAQRAAAAAKEIKHLVDDSTERTRIGAKQVQQAGSTMMDIVASVRRVTEIMSDIAQATEEQSAGIEQVNIAIGQMDEVTQQNAALVEQAAAAAGALEDQASSLTWFVRRFKIEQQRLAIAA